jgi:primosomal protein N' (replication factor Y)
VTEYIIKEAYLKWLFKISEYYITPVGEFINLCLLDKNFTTKEPPSFYEKDSELISISQILKKYGKRIFDKELKSELIVPREFKYVQNIDEELLTLDRSKPTLIFGPTGSGKTSTYLKEIKSNLNRNKQVLLMLPEVLLSEYFCQRIFSLLGFWPHSWNYKTHPLAKKSIWEWAISGEPGLIVGSRSSLWLPLSNLGLIVVDEEHDYSYKQENLPIYDAKNAAILRANYEGIHCTLVSATPSLETWNKVLQGKYNKLEVYGKQSITEKIIELKSSKWLSDDLLENIKVTIANKEQCLIFLNKKGFSSSIICSECLNILQCSHCSVNVTFYKNNLCQCSQCNTKTELNICLKCRSRNWNLGGVGIEQVEELLKKKFYSAKIISISSENIHISENIDLIYQGLVDIIISTQVLSKGYTFPKLTLVAVLEGDRNLLKADPRFKEKIYQLITQVRGRCGRSALPGTFIIQNSSKNMGLISDILISDYPTWASKELEERGKMQLPPYKQIIRFLVKAKNTEVAKRVAEDLFSNLKNIPNISITPPSKALIYKIRNQFRYNIILQNDTIIYPQRRIISVINKIDKNKNKKKYSLVIDVDPYTFM